MKPVDSYFYLHHFTSDETIGVFSTYDKAEQYMIQNDLSTYPYQIVEVDFYG